MIIPLLYRAPSKLKKVDFGDNLGNLIDIRSEIARVNFESELIGMKCIAQMLII